MKKNDLIELSVTDVTLEGSGVGHVDGIAVFVPATVTGDKVLAHILKVKPNCAFAKAEKILSPSELRIDADCPSFLKCGGCAFRHINYNAELEIKENAVKNNLRRIGKCEPEFEKITFLRENGYRNKCQYPVSEKDGSICIGFFAPHSHRVTDSESCALEPSEFKECIGVFRKFIKDYNISAYDEMTGKGLLRHIYLRKAFATEEILVCAVINGDSLPNADKLIGMLKEKLNEKLKSFAVNINKKKTNVILGEKCIPLYGDGYITDVLCDVKVRISPLSFYQVNHDMAELLYKKAAEYAEPEGKTVLDLYCGAGTIGLSMAKKAKKIIGVEIIPEAVEDAKFNTKLNSSDNAEFMCGNASLAAKTLSDRGVKPDVVIVDPPRKGCEPELIKTVACDFCPERVVYVSCDSATLSRDVRLFEELGYKVQKAAPFDLFPRTSHVETVALLVRTVSPI